MDRNALSIKFAGTFRMILSNYANMPKKSVWIKGKFFTINFMRNRLYLSVARSEPNKWTIVAIPGYVDDAGGARWQAGRGKLCYRFGKAVARGLKSPWFVVYRHVNYPIHTSAGLSLTRFHPCRNRRCVWWQTKIPRSSISLWLAVVNTAEKF